MTTSICNWPELTSDWHRRQRRHTWHMNVTDYIRDIPDFPHEGILFKDICPLLGHAAALRSALDGMASLINDQHIDIVVGIESRGFIFAPGIAERLGVGFVPMRKPGKLPWQTHAIDYGLEYGKDRLEVQTDAFTQGQRVLLVDDVLATGGTIAAAAQLCQQAGAQAVAACFLLAITALEGAQRAALPCHALIEY